MKKAAKVSALPVAIDFDLVEESDYRLEFQLTDAAGDGIDLSTEQVAFTVRASPKENDDVVRIVNGVGAHSDPVAGKSAFPIGGDDLQLAAGTLDGYWYYDVVRIDAEGKETPYFAGKLVVHRRTSGTDPVA